MKLKGKLRRSLFEVKREGYVKGGIPKGGVLDCSLGTNPYGFPEGILSGINLENFDLSKYPNPYHDLLREALVEYWKGAFSKEEVFIGAGSMGCLEKINKFAIKEGSRILGYAPQFSEYITEVRIMGGVYDYVQLRKESDFEFELGPLIEKISNKYTLIYIDNPNNPTGQTIPINILEEIIQKAAKEGIIVIVDEAYGDFMDPKNSAINLDCENLIVVRSFSKGFGLANLRVGYAVIKGKELRELYSKINLPFQISTLSEILAIRVLGHNKFIEKSKKLISKEKNKILNFLKGDFCISKTSLTVPIFLAGKEGTNMYEYMLRKGILTVDGRNFVGLDSSYVRIRMPPAAKMFIEKLKES